MLMHLGTELGHGAEGEVEGEVGCVGGATVVSDSEPVTGALPVGAQVVQTEVEVWVTVETVEYVVGISEPPEVIVVVTGQVVTVS